MKIRATHLRFLLSNESLSLFDGLVSVCITGRKLLFIVSAQVVNADFISARAIAALAGTDAVPESLAVTGCKQSIAL